MPSSSKLPGVVYPRIVPCPAGMPEGWDAIEKAYGEASAYYGKTYVRFTSKDGRHKHVISPKACIERHCQDTGEEFGAVFALYEETQRERKQAEAELRDREREGTGKLKGEAREAAIDAFRAEYGELEGKVVFCFKGWTTRWVFRHGCGQTMVTYIDTEKNEWKLLKDVEMYLWSMIMQGKGDHIPNMIEEAKLMADAARFAEGGRGARESGRTSEIEGYKANAGVKVSADGEAFSRPIKRVKTEVSGGAVETDMRAVHRQPPVLDFPSSSAASASKFPTKPGG